MRGRVGRFRTSVRDTLTAINLIDWRAVVAPTAFALLAIGLLIMNHIQERVDGLLYWLTLALIIAVFVWLVDTNRKRATMIAWQAEGALRDDVTGIGNRAKLWADVTAGLALHEHRVMMLVELDGLEDHMGRHGYSEGDAVLRRVGEKLADHVSRLRGYAYRVEGSQFALLVPAPDKGPAEIAVAATTSLAEDVDELMELSYGGVSLPAEAASPEAAFELSTHRLVARKHRQRRSASRQAHAALLAVLSARRPELRDHVRDIAFRVLAVGRALGIGEDELDDIVRAAQLQDIGLLAVPESVLESEAPLSEFERRMIDDHTVEGERIISAAPGLEPVAKLVRSSGERYDGNGRPDGLRGEEIPLGSRIIAVCVAFAAMTSSRPYRHASMTEQGALAELRAESGAQFDPAVVETLADDLDHDA